MFFLHFEGRASTGGLPTLPKKGLGRLLGEAELDGVPAKSPVSSSAYVEESRVPLVGKSRQGRGLLPPPWSAGSLPLLVPQRTALQEHFPPLVTRLSCCPCTRRFSWC